MNETKQMKSGGLDDLTKNNKFFRNAAAKLAKETQTQPTVMKYKWIQYAIYFWAARLSFGAVGVIFGGFNLYRFLFPVDITPIYAPIEILSWDNGKILQKIPLIREKGVPVIIRGIQVPSLIVTDKLIKSIFSTKNSTNKNIKYSNESYFTHFSSDRLWTSLYNIQPYHSSYKNNLPFIIVDGKIDAEDNKEIDNNCNIDSNNEDINTCNNNNNNKNNNNFNSSYWYLSEPIDDPADSPILQAIAPSMLDILIKLEATKRSSIGPKANIWLGSNAGITTSPHYDMEDNFLLQVSGSKSLMISSPENYNIFTPLSSLHPHWRQAQNRYLTTKDKVIEEFNRLNKNNNDEVKNDNSYNLLLNSTWDVNLEAGDLIYIPPFYFHSATTGEQSTSINMWTSSIGSNAYNKIITTAQLPFEPNDSNGKKLGSLASLFRSIIIDWGEKVPVVMELMRSRIDNLIDNKAYNCQPWQGLGDLPGKGVCTSIHIKFGETNGQARRSEIHVNSFLNNHGLQPAMKIILLMDYIEEVLELIFNGKITPCDIEDFLFTCVQKKKN